MELPFSHLPGRFERHLRRCHGSPLFAWPPREVSPEELLEAQRRDRGTLLAFREALDALLQRAVDLPPIAESEAVLGLKEDLERAYEETFGLPEDHTRERAALARLIQLTMQAVERAAGSDPTALKELGDEVEARAIHFAMLEHPLVADLLHPDCPIPPSELAPALLCAAPEETAAALDLFDAEQLGGLADTAARILADLEARGLDLAGPRERLALIRERADHAMARLH